MGNSATRKERDSDGQRLHGYRRRCRQGRTTTVGNDEGCGRGQWCSYVVGEAAIEEKGSGDKQGQQEAKKAKGGGSD
ncbi:hypothetical protein B296_00018241 [Ensete ventricosum]|uniref:Uncharacterized protein n=1 Tax=Ensete ventricosum TaxID=4639 RepID=A0A426YXG7_ENSVE|nr:hypothetical protein B296_00018241 [Ensete ventricosum]